MEDESTVIMNGMHYQWRRQRTPKARDVEGLFGFTNAVNMFELFEYLSRL